MKRISFVRVFWLLLVLSMVFTALAACAVSPYPYELEDYITVPENWNEMSIRESEIALRVHDMIQQARENAAIREIVISRPSEEGDLVDISLVCYRSDEYGKGGATIDILSDAGCLLKLGEGKYPHELEDSLKGRYAGDSFVVRMTLPDSYTVSGYAGTTVVYEVSVNNITALRLPLYNDAFVRSISGCESVEEYEEVLYERAKEDIVWENMFRVSEAKLYPEEELNSHRSDYVTYYTNLATEADISLEMYVGKKFFISLTDFHREAENYAKETVKKELLLYYLERKYDLEVSDSEYNEIAKKYANENGLVSVSALEEKFGKEYLRKTVQYDKVLAYIAQSVTVAEDIV